MSCEPIGLEAAPDGFGASRRALGRAFAAGVVAASPTLMMLAPFGALCGAIFAETGLTAVEALSFSVFIYAGASQLATLELLRDGASIFVILATGVAINLRFLMYSATLAPCFAGAPLGARAAAGYFSADNIVSVALIRFRERPVENASERIAFFVGCGVFSWVFWQGSTAFGYLVGAAAPDWLGLDFAAPIAFIAIAMPLLVDRPSWAAALAASVASALLRDLPANTGVIIAAVVGIAAALSVESLAARRDGERQA